LDPIGVLSTCGIHRTVIANVWAIKVSGTSLIFVVWLQRLALPEQATPKSMNAILIMQAFHTNLVPVPANPIHPLLRRIIEPPWTQAGMLRKVDDRHVRTTSAITCWMAFLISWTENLIGVEMTCGRSWLHAEIEFPVHSTFPATCTAIQLT
jgi:hypothetical protein